jgi:hypothetical protein
MLDITTVLHDPLFAQDGIERSPETPSAKKVEVEPLAFRRPHASILAISTCARTRSRQALNRVASTVVLTSST